MASDIKKWAAGSIGPKPQGAKQRKDAIEGAVTAALGEFLALERSAMALRDKAQALARDAMTGPEAGLAAKKAALHSAIDAAAAAYQKAADKARSNAARFPDNKMLASRVGEAQASADRIKGAKTAGGGFDRRALGM